MDTGIRDRYSEREGTGISGAGEGMEHNSRPPFISHPLAKCPPPPHSPSQVINNQPLERFHSRGHHLYKFIETKESVNINSHKTGLEHQPPTQSPQFGTPICLPLRHVKLNFALNKLEASTPLRLLNQAATRRCPGWFVINQHTLQQKHHFRYFETNRLLFHNRSLTSIQSIQDCQFSFIMFLK